MSAQSLLAHDAHDQQLLANVHPADWVNPTPTKRYNLVVVGAGTAGLVSAVGAAGLGAKVAIVEKNLLGGDCLNVGCVPSKALIRCARVAAEVRDAGQFGVRVPEGWNVDFPAIMERMRKLRASISPADSVQRLTNLGIDVFLGQAEFIDESSLKVGDSTLSFAKAIIATGARAKIPNIPGLDEAGFLTNETLFNLTELPKRFAVLGGGPIGCEMAQAFRRFGSEVTLINDVSRILSHDDAKAATLVMQAFDHDGVTVLNNTKLTRVEFRNGTKILHLETGSHTRTIECDAILVGVGRQPNIEGMNLEKANVQFNEHGIDVSDTLRSSNPNIFAAGDVASKYKFTHAADAMARIAIANSLFNVPLKGMKKVSDLIIPWCTYTDPEVAHVGLTEAEAEKQNIAVRKFTTELKDVDRAILDGETAGYAELLVEADGDKILGATIVAAHAGEMISEVTLAMVGKLGLGTLAETIHPYPTQAEAIKKSADAYNRTRLTPTVKWLFDKWLTWSR